MAKHGHKLMAEKAKMMLHEGTVKGKKITKKQRGFFGLLTRGKKPTRMKK